MTHSFPTRRSSDLDRRRNRSNVAARCGSCDHRGVVDGGVLWRWFALHRWKSRPTDLVEHMRCSICRRRPVELEATSESPTLEFGPRDEIGWQEVVTRLRSAPPPQPDRPEEHTSELQALKRFSNAAFCMEKQPDIPS